MKNNLSFISPTYKVFYFLLCTLFARLLPLHATKPIEVDDEKEAYDDSTNNKAYNLVEHLEQMDDEVVSSIEIIKKGLHKNDVTEVCKGLKSLRKLQIKLTKQQAQDIYKALIGINYVNKQPELIRFFVDMIKKYPKLKAILFAYIEASKKNKKDKNVAIRSSNSATILNAADVPLSNQNWRGVRIPRADMSYAHLHYTDLRDSNLEDVNLYQAYMPYTRLENANLKDVQFGEFPYLNHPNKFLRCIAWSPDSKYVASGADHNIYIWDVIKNQCIHTLISHKRSVETLSWSPDGTYIASGAWDGGVVLIWDTRKWEIAQVLWGHEVQIDCVRWSPDGKWIAITSRDEKMRIRNTKNWKVVHTLKLIRREESHLSWSPNGRRIAFTNAGDRIYIWDILEERIVDIVYTYEHSETSWVSWSPDGKKLAIGHITKYPMKIWDIRNKKCLKIIRGYAERIIQGGTWSPDGNWFAIVTYGNKMKIFDTKNWKCVNVNSSHQSRIKCLSWSPNGEYIASASEQENLMIWNTKVRSYTRTFSDCDKYDDYIWSWSPKENQIALTANDPWVQIWDTKTWRCTCILSLDKDVIGNAKWSPSGDRIAIGSKDTMVWIWDTQTWELLWKLNGHKYDILDVSWCPTLPLIASTSLDSNINIWDVESGELLYFLEYTSGKSWPEMSWSFYGNLIATIDQNMVRIWDTKTGKHLGTLKTDKVSRSRKPVIRKYNNNYCKWRNPVKLIKWFSSGDQIAIGYKDNNLRIWDLKNMQIVCTFSHTIDIEDATLSPDRNLIWVSSWDNKVCIWDLKKKEKIITLTSYSARTSNWSPNGKQFATLDEHNVNIWDTQSLKCIKKWRDHGGEFRLIKWSPNGKKFATLDEHSVNIWDTKSWKCIKRWPDHGGRIGCVEWSPDGNWMLISKGYIQIWDTRTGKFFIMGLTGLVCKHLNIKGALQLSSSNKKLIKQLGGIVDSEEEKEEEPDQQIESINESNALSIKIFAHSNSLAN